MPRAILASYWTALALGVAALALHVRWYIVDNPAGGEVVSGFGAALVVLGVFVGSRPYIRAGFAGLVQAGLPPRQPAMPYGGIRGSQADVDAFWKERSRVVRDMRAERVVAVVVVVLGTLLNGYGPLVARMLGLRAG